MSLTFLQLPEDRRRKAIEECAARQQIPDSFRLLPADNRVHALRRDYQAMRDMYLSEPLSFDEVLSQLSDLEKQINVGGEC